MGASAPCKFTLHPCEGVRVEIDLDEYGETKVNGKYAGNRYGAVQALITIVNQHKPEIEYT
jgi:hypothetical protein